MKFHLKKYNKETWREIWCFSVLHQPLVKSHRTFSEIYHRKILWKKFPRVRDYSILESCGSYLPTPFFSHEPLCEDEIYEPPAPSKMHIKQKLLIYICKDFPRIHDTQLGIPMWKLWDTVESLAHFNIVYLHFIASTVSILIIYLLNCCLKTKLLLSQAPIVF